MNCQSVRDHLVDHWDQTPPDRPLQEHLQQCAACRQLSAEYSLSAQLVQDLPEVEPAENFEWRLRLRLNQVDKEGFVEPQQESTASRRLSSMQFAGSAAAAALVVVAVGFLALRAPDSGLRQGSPSPQDVAQETAADDSAAPSGLAAAGEADVAWDTPAQLRWASDPDRPGLPNLAPTRPDYLRVVPVSAGVPFGPEATALPAPSILGDALPRPTVLPR